MKGGYEIFAAFGLNPGYFHHQISQSLGSIEPAGAAGGLGHACQPRGLGCKA
jgi:hypothetical protein